MPWLPTDVGSLYAWYDAADTATITKTGNLVNQWNDKSGNTRHVIGSGVGRPNSGTRNVNNQNVIDFDSGETLLKTSFSLSQPFTVFAVIAQDSRAGADRYFDGYEGSTAGRALLHTLSNVWNMQAGSATSTGHTPVLGGITVYHTVVFDGASSLFRESGTQYGGALNPGTGGMPSLNIATDGVGGGEFDGAVCELFIYSTVISGTDLTNAEAYLNNKWIIDPHPSAASSTGTAYNPTVSIPASVSPTTATGTGTANNATVNIGLSRTPTTATATGVAQNAYVNTPSPNAQSASSTGTANNPVISISISRTPNTATATRVAQNPTITITTTPIQIMILQPAIDAEILLEWWNSAYRFRKEVRLDNLLEDVEPGHTIEVAFDPELMYAYGKLREDWADIEVVYTVLSESGIPNHTLISREATEDYVRFQLVEPLEKGDSTFQNYYIYFGNWDLVAQPDNRPEYIEDLWPVNKTPDAPQFTYTRPGEYWEDGKAMDRLAIATLYFYGEGARINSEKGPQAGVAEVSIDNGLWTEVDLFEVTTSTETVFEVTNLTSAKHKIQLRPAGKKNPSATSVQINFVSIDYLTPVQSTLGSEEINNVDWASVMSGSN